MKLLAKPLLTWVEPTFFPVRMRDRRGWIGRGVLATVIFLGMLAAFYADRHWGKGPRFSILGGITLAAVIGVVLTGLADAPNWRRDITISDDSVSYFGNAGTAFSAGSFPLRSIRCVRLVRPDELGRSFGALEIVTARGVEQLGVPPSLAPERIAQVLHGQGVAVQLSGWEPAAPEAAAPAAAPTEPAGPLPGVSARIEPLPEGEADGLRNSIHYKLALLLYLGPLTATVLTGLGLIGYQFVRYKFFHDPLGAAEVARLLGGMALVVGGLTFTVKYGNLPPTLYLRHAARSRFEARPDAAFDPRDPEAVFVDVVPRAHWGKAMVNEAADMGFLKVDPVARCVLFEGDRERWRIPAASLVSAEIETYRPAGHVEGQEGGELKAVVVLKARRGDEVWEGPLMPAHVDLRPRTNDHRRAAAESLRHQIAALRPAMARPVGLELGR